MNRHDRIRKILAKVPSGKTGAADSTGEPEIYEQNRPKKPAKNLRKKYAKFTAALLILGTFYFAYVYFQFLVRLVASH